MATETFAQYVDRWDALCGEVSSLKAQLAEKQAEELIMRQAIAASVSTALGPQFKEGTNKLAVGDGRMVKVSHVVRRTVLKDERETARSMWAAANDLPVGTTFEEVIKEKVGYTVSKTALDKLTGTALKAVEHCIVSKIETPKVELA